MSTRTAPRLAGVREQVRRLAAAVATPLVPEDYLDLLAPLQSTTLRGRIEAVLAETRDAATLVIRPGRSWRGHRPGQYVRVGVDVNGVRLWRAYSVTSPADVEGPISITVKAIPDGVVSHHLVHRARPGTIVQLDQATGEFTLPEHAPAKILFITAGSGITPVMGMLRSRATEFVDVVHLHASPTRQDAIFGEELRRLSGEGRIVLREQHDDVHGLLTPERLRELVGDLPQRETWACGPTGMLDMLERTYADAGIADRLHTERFRPTFVAAGEGGTVTFAKQAAIVTADAATPILTAGESAGVLMPSGCRMGICYGCVAPLTRGAVRDLRTGEMTTAVDGDNVQIQTCISAPAGDCQIEL